MPHIFISYRRTDSAQDARRLYDRLVRAFGEEQVFIDVHDIPPGRDFRGILMESVTACDVVLAVIGPQWLTIKDDKGNRRLDNHEDFVRIELETALHRDQCLLIPILINDASIPSADDLPLSLRELAFKNAVKVRSKRYFALDVERLIKQLGQGEASYSVAKSRADKKRVSDEIIAARIGCIGMIIAAIIGAVALLASAVLDDIDLFKNDEDSVDELSDPPTQGVSQTLSIGDVNPTNTSIAATSTNSIVALQSISLTVYRSGDAIAVCPGVEVDLSALQVGDFRYSFNTLFPDLTNSEECWCIELDLESDLDFFPRPDVCHDNNTAEIDVTSPTERNTWHYDPLLLFADGQRFGECEAQPSNPNVYQCDSIWVKEN
jgi:hypothetical protein